MVINGFEAGSTVGGVGQNQIVNFWSLVLMVSANPKGELYVLHVHIGELFTWVM